MGTSAIFARRHGRRAILATAITAITAAGGALAYADSPTAHQARSIDGVATAHLHLMRAEGSELWEEGPVAGTLHGTMKATMKTGAELIGSFTLRTHQGTIRGQGTANPHGSGRYQSFAGSFTATSGTQLYAHVHGHAGLYGTFDRRTDALVVQTTGQLSY